MYLIIEYYFLFHWGGKMKKSLYEYAIAASKANRRTFLKGAAGAGAVAAMSGGLIFNCKFCFCSWWS